MTTPPEPAPARSSVVVARHFRAVGLQLLRHWPVAVISVVNAVVVALTFQGLYIVQYVDGHYPLNAHVVFFHSLYLWNDLQGAGIPNGGDVANLPLWSVAAGLQSVMPPALAEAVLAYAAVQIGGLSMYALLSNTEVRGKPFIPVLGSLVYLFNPYVLSEYFSAPPSLWLAWYAVVPLSVLLYTRILAEKSARISRSFVLILALVLVLFVGEPGIQSGLEGPVILFFGVILVWQLVGARHNARRLGYMILSSATTLALFVGANLFWEVPYLGSYVLSPGIPTHVTSLLNNSAHTQFFNVVRLLGENQWYSVPPYQSYPFATLFTSHTSPLLPLSLVFPILALIGVTTFHDRDITGVCVVLAVISLTIDMGSQPPFGSAYVELVSNSAYGWYFRNPYQTFGWIQAFAWTVLFAKGSGWVASRLAIRTGPSIVRTRSNRRPFSSRSILWTLHTRPLDRAKHTISFAVAVMVVIAPLVYVFPIWTGSAIPSHLPAQSLPSARTEIPSYYSNLSTFLDSRPGDYRVLDLPYPGILLRTNWSYGMWSQPFLWNLLNRPVYEGQYENMPLTNDFIRNITVLLNSNETSQVWKALYQLDVGIVLLRFDGASYNQGQPTINLTQMDLALRSQSHVSQVADFGKIEVFATDSFPGTLSAALPEFVGPLRNDVISASPVWDMRNYLSMNYPRVVGSLGLNGSLVVQGNLSVQQSGESLNISIEGGTIGQRAVWNQVPIEQLVGSGWGVNMDLLVPDQTCLRVYGGVTNQSGPVSWKNVSWVGLRLVSYGQTSCGGYSNLPRGNYSIDLNGVTGLYLDYLQFGLSLPSASPQGGYVDVTQPALVTNASMGIEQQKNTSLALMDNNSVTFETLPGASGARSLFTSVPLGLQGLRTVGMHLDFSTGDLTKLWPMIGVSKYENATIQDARWYSPSWSTIDVQPNGGYISSSSVNAYFGYTFSPGLYVDFVQFKIMSTGSAAVASTDFSNVSLVTDMWLANAIGESLMLSNTTATTVATVQNSTPSQYSPDAFALTNVSYAQSTPTQYEATVGPCDCMVLLVFLEAYSESWHARIVGAGGSLVGHWLVDGYANGFVMSVNGTVSVLIDYAGQSLEGYALALSLAFILGDLFALLLLVGMPYVRQHFPRSSHSHRG